LLYIKKRLLHSYNYKLQFQLINRILACASKFGCAFIYNKLATLIITIQSPQYSSWALLLFFLFFFTKKLVELLWLWLQVINFKPIQQFTLTASSRLTFTMIKSASLPQLARELAFIWYCYSYDDDNNTLKHPVHNLLYVV
jgi:hypothetical protein